MATPPVRSAELVEQIVESRLERQQQVLLSEGRPDFTAILDMAVLHRVVGGKQVMRAQLERLVELSQLPRVSIRVVPFEAGALPSENNKFIILSFAAPELTDVVFVEALTGDLYLETQHDLDLYHAAFKRLGAMAASPAASRSIVEAMINSYR